MVKTVLSVPTRNRSIATPTAVSAAATPTAAAGLTPSTVAISERSGIGHGPPGRSRSTPARPSRSHAPRAARSRVATRRLVAPRTLSRRRARCCVDRARRRRARGAGSRPVRSPADATASGVAADRGGLRCCPRPRACPGSFPCRRPIRSAISRPPPGRRRPPCGGAGCPGHGARLLGQRGPRRRPARGRATARAARGCRRLGDEVAWIALSAHRRGPIGAARPWAPQECRRRAPARRPGGAGPRRRVPAAAARVRRCPRHRRGARSPGHGSPGSVLTVVATPPLVERDQVLIGRRDQLGRRHRARRPLDLPGSGSSPSATWSSVSLRAVTSTRASSDETVRL